jgi:hypothetical protein
MDVIDLPLGQIIPYARNPRKNEKAVATVAASIAEFGWRQPIVVDEAMVVLAGHTRLEAARQLGLGTAPVHVAKGLSEAQARAFRFDRPSPPDSDPNTVGRQEYFTSSKVTRNNRHPATGHSAFLPAGRVEDHDAALRMVRATPKGRPLGSPP